MEGVHGTTNTLDLERARRMKDRPDFSRPNNGVIQRKMRWPFMFMLIYHCHWAWKGRTDVNERV